MLMADLFVCCVWLMCLVCGKTNGLWILPSLWIAPLLRMWLSFLMYRRSRMALAPIVMLLVFVARTFCVRNGALLFTLFTDPLLTLLRSVPVLFGVPVVTAENMPDIWFAVHDYRFLIGTVASIWLVVIPLVIYIYRCVKKINVPGVLGLRQGIGLCAYLVGVIVVENFVVAHFHYSHISVFILALLLMLIPILFNNGKLEGMLSKGEQAFIISLILSGMAYSFGISYNNASELAAGLLPAAFFAILCRLLDRKVRYDEVLFIISGSFLFVFSQYTLGMFRIGMLLLSLGLMAVPFIRVASSTMRYRSAVVGYVAIALFIPVFCIGYNPYSVLEARKICHYDEYDYSPHGLMLVCGEDGSGIRDRYELILPAEYKRIEHLISSKPYCKVETDGGWKIYDIVRQEFLSEEVFEEVIPYADLSYLLKSDAGDRYLIIPRTYSRFCDEKVAVISEQPPVFLTENE